MFKKKKRKFRYEYNVMVINEIYKLRLDLNTHYYTASCLHAVFATACNASDIWTLCIVFFSSFRHVKTLPSGCSCFLCSKFVGCLLTALNIYYSIKGFTLAVHIYSSWYAERVNKKELSPLDELYSVKPLLGVGRLRGLLAGPNLWPSLWKHWGVVRQWHQFLVLQLFLLSRP